MNMGIALSVIMPRVNVLFCESISIITSVLVNCSSSASTIKTPIAWTFDREPFSALLVLDNMHSTDFPNGGISVGGTMSSRTSTSSPSHIFTPYNILREVCFSTTKCQEDSF